MLEAALREGTFRNTGYQAFRAGSSQEAPFRGLPVKPPVLPVAVYNPFTLYRITNVMLYE